MKTISIILVILMVLCCCTSTHFIMHDQSALDELSNKLEGEKAKIMLVNDDVVVGENINVRFDSTSWLETHEPIYHWTPSREPIKNTIFTPKVYKIEVMNRGQGAWTGMKYGFLSGALVGGLLGAIGTAAYGAKGGILGAETILYAGLLGGGLCAIVGFSIGYAIGSTEEYIIK